MMLRIKLICQLSSLFLACATASVRGQSLGKNQERKNSGDIVTIKFNRNVEFLGYALHMGDPENDPLSTTSHPLRELLDEKRNRLQNEGSLIRVFELASELPYSFFVELFTRMDPLPHEREYTVPDDIMQNYQLNTPADRVLIKQIMEQINRFYQVSEFDAFWDSSQSWYAKAMEEITPIKPDDELIETMEHFYGQTFASYKVIPSLTFWSGPGFGFKEEGNAGSTAYFVLGPLTNDLRFDLYDRLKTLSIHEFGHSFANELLASTCADLIRETKTLFEPIAETMSAQGYPAWSYCVNEHFVRAGEVLIPELMNDRAMSEANLKHNVEVKEFIYLPFIVERLRTYRIEEKRSYSESIKKTMWDLKKEFMP